LWLAEHFNIPTKRRTVSALHKGSAMVMSVIRRLRERWHIYRERKVRLNASRYATGGAGMRDGMGPRARRSARHSSIRTPRLS
jgi:hypothetical protein